MLSQNLSISNWLQEFEQLKWAIKIESHKLLANKFLKFQNKTYLGGQEVGGGGGGAISIIFHVAPVVTHIHSLMHLEQHCFNVTFHACLNYTNYDCIFKYLSFEKR